MTPSSLMSPTLPLPLEVITLDMLQPGSKFPPACMAFGPCMTVRISACRSTHPHTDTPTHRHTDTPTHSNTQVITSFAFSGFEIGRLLTTAWHSRLAA